MNQAETYFGVIDFVIFGVVLLLSALIGVFFAYRDRRKQTTDNYYYGDRSLSPFPVAMSLSVSFISAVTVIGVPVEVYLFGGIFIWGIIAWVIACIYSGLYYLPLIYRLSLSTINQYLELRFHKALRKVVSFMVMFQLILYMGITIYLPSLALSAVTPLELSSAIFLTSAICTFYTSIGGMKAVIWTDVMQGFIMLVGSLAVFFQSVKLIGGLDEVMDAVERGGRDNFIVTNWDLRIRSTTWTLLIGQLTFWGRVVCTEQTVAQRFLSCQSQKKAKIALFIGCILATIFFLVALANGFAMYAYYEGCDPVKAGVIEKADQSIPLMAVQVFQSLPGLAGLFVSAGYSGTLSTVSSGINSLAVMTLMDFVMPLWPRTSHKRQMVLSKIFSVLFGCLVMGLAYVISMMTSNAIGITSVLLGFISGPIFGVYTMGIFMPWTNHKGAIVGIVCGWILTAWLAIASIVVPPLAGTRNPLPMSIDNCTVTQDQTSTTATLNSSVPYIYSGDMEEHANYQSTSVPAAPDQRPLIYDTLYSVSPFLFVTLGFLACIVTGTVVSIFTGPNKPSEAKPELFVPIIDNKILPEKIRKFFRFGVPEITSIEEEKHSSTGDGKGERIEDNLLLSDFTKSEETKTD